MHIYASQFIWSLIRRSNEYPESPMDLHGSCCLHKNCRLSPSMDHLVDTAFSFILLSLTSFFLPVCLLHFFPFLFYFSIPVRSYLYLWESYLVVCIILTNAQVPFDVNTFPPYIMLFFFFLMWYPKQLPEGLITETHTGICGGDHE